MRAARITAIQSMLDIQAAPFPDDMLRHVVRPESDVAATPAGAFHRRPAATAAVDRQIPAGAVHVRIGLPLRVHVERGKPTFRLVDAALQRRGAVGERSERVRGPGERLRVGRVDAVEPVAQYKHTAERSMPAAGQDMQVDFEPVPFAFDIIHGF